MSIIQLGNILVNNFTNKLSIILKEKKTFNFVFPKPYIDIIVNYIDKI